MWTGLGLGIGIGSLGVRLPTPKNIASELVSPTRLSHVLILGDSRLVGTQVSLDQYCPIVHWGGFDLDTNVVDYSGAHDTETSGIPIGDTSSSSPWVGGTINAWSPRQSYEAKFLGGAEPALGDDSTQMRLTGNPNLNSTNYPYLWSRAVGQAGKARALIYNNASGMGNNPGVAIHIRCTGANFSGTGNILGSYFDDFTGTGYTELYTDIPDSHDWENLTSPSIEVLAAPAGATVSGEIAAIADKPWFEMTLGTVVHNWSVGSRSIDGFLDDTVFNSGLFGDFAPLFGRHLLAWIDLGTNNPQGNNQAEHEALLISLIENFRAGSPGAPVMITTSYPSSVDVGVPYYVLAARAVAATVPGVLLVDTYEEMPAYADAVSLGWMADTFHYNSTGVAAYCEKIGNLIFDTADNYTPSDSGTVLVGWDGNEGVTSPPNYTELTGQGTLGETWDILNATNPTIYSIRDLIAPEFAGAAGFQASIASSNFTRLHDGVSDATLIFRGLVTTLSTTQFLFTTFPTSNSATGIALFLEASGAVKCNIGNSTASHRKIVSSVTLAVGDYYNISLRKSGSDIIFQVNRESPIVTTVTSPDNSDPDFPATIGNRDAGDFSALGVICGGYMFGEDIGKEEALKCTNYLSARWRG